VLQGISRTRISYQSKLPDFLCRYTHDRFGLSFRVIRSLLFKDLFRKEVVVCFSGDLEISISMSGAFSCLVLSPGYKFFGRSGCTWRVLSEASLHDSDACAVRLWLVCGGAAGNRRHCRSGQQQAGVTSELTG